MKLVVGLGNIGKRYELTRHNAGFLALDYIAEQENLFFSRQKKYYIVNKRVDDQKLIFIKPTTYMNLSGIAVRDVVNFFNIDAENIVILHDDVDIKFGEIRVKKGGSAGGHNGIKSIISEIGTSDFLRVRIGIKNDMESFFDLSDFVLSKFNNDELKNLNKIFEGVYDIIVNYVVSGNLNVAQQKYNKKNLLI